MAENIERSTGRPREFTFDRGGVPSEMGPYIGVVTNNIDVTRSGKLQVYIQEFGAIDKEGKPLLTDSTLWKTVKYVSPFYGITPLSQTSNESVGKYPNNQQSYGMWFTAPDVGTRVLCFFPAGDANDGYYIGCIPETGLTHMIPAVGATSEYQTNNDTQQQYFAEATQLPVTEINDNSQENSNGPKFFDNIKPVHSYQAATFFQQGLINDTQRGPITSSSQRETPSAVFGFSTPGRPIYQGGLQSDDIRQKLLGNQVLPQDVAVTGRVGGHSFVMDDGDLEGNDNLVRIRTSQGHQITMSDSGNFFYITHANGQTWIELGAQGTVDVFSTNSINLRTNGDINFHADRDINMFAGRNVNVKAEKETNLGGVDAVKIASDKDVSIYAGIKLGIKSEAILALKSAAGSWDAGGPLTLKGRPIFLNGPAALPVETPKLYPKVLLDDTTYNYSTGWQVKPNGLTSIVSRAPTHEPYPYHNTGVDVQVSLETGSPPPPPAAVPVPDGWTIEVKS
jgi:hypothetical protein